MQRTHTLVAICRSEEDSGEIRAPTNLQCLCQATDYVAPPQVVARAALEYGATVKFDDRGANVNEGRGGICATMLC